MILERARQLQQLAVTLQASETLKEDRRRFEDRRQRLDTAAQQLERLLGQWTFLKRHHIVRHEQIPSNLDAALSTTARLRSDARRNPQALIQEGFPLTLEALERFNGALEQTMKGAWARHCQSLLPRTDRELLEVLASVPNLSLNVRRLNAKLAELQQFEGRVPSTEAALASVKQAALVAKQEHDAVMRADIPAGVIGFFRAVMQGGAPIDLLTPDVQAWLREHRLAGAFHVRPTGSAS